jgi:hypothetical protein
VHAGRKLSVVDEVLEERDEVGAVVLADSRE